jgi:hypothetical protein
MFPSPEKLIDSDAEWSEPHLELSTRNRNQLHRLGGIRAIGWGGSPVIIDRVGILIGTRSKVKAVKLRMVGS